MHAPFGGHLYLVIREQGDLDPERADVIAGNRQGSSGALIAQVMPLQDSFDQYVAGEGPFTHRRALDITSTILANSGFGTAEQAWAHMQGVASTIGSVYTYHPFDYSGRDNAVSNSNAFVLSVLNSVNVDVRNFSNVQSNPYTFGLPGATFDLGWSTLLGEGTGASANPWIIASENLSQGVAVLGRVGVDDRMIGTRLADAFIGEQGAEGSPNKLQAYLNSADIVSYERSDAAVQVHVKASGEGGGKGGHAEGDVYFGIEGFLGSNYDDYARIDTPTVNWFNWNYLDGGDGNDMLDGGDGYDWLIGGAGADTFVVGGKGQDHIVDAEAADRLFIRVDWLSGNPADATRYLPISAAAKVNGGLTIPNGSASISARQWSQGPYVPDLQDYSYVSSNIFGFDLEVFFWMLNSDLQITIYNNEQHTHGDRYEVIIENYELGDLGIAYFDRQTPPPANNSATMAAVNGGQFETIALPDVSGNRGPQRTASLPFTDDDDIMTGSVDPDYLKGGNGNDHIDGGAGNDVVEGGDGDDTVLGGDGNDQIIAGSGEGNDAYDGGSGDDVIVFSSTTQGVVVDLAAGTASGSETGADTLAGIEHVVGGAGDDDIGGDAGDNALLGADGNDALAGRDGADTLSGDAGDDLITGGGGNDTISGGAGTDTAAFSGNRADYLTSYDPGTQTYTVADQRAGSPDGTDAVAEVELLRFADGTVAVTEANAAPTGATLDGDTVAENSAAGTVIGTVTGHDPDAGDTLSYSLTDDAGGRFAIDAVTGVITVADGSLLDYESATAHVISVQVTDQDGLTFDQPLTIMLTDVAGVTLTGTEANDTLTGTSSEDTLIGLGGNDILKGGLGADSMTGGAGNDTYTADDADDRIIENAEEGTDTVKTALAGYALGDNVENLTGTGQGSQTLTGNSLNNTIAGGAGDDTLSGGDGNDSLNGGTGADGMTGGAGNDAYTVDNAGDTVTENAAEGTDTIKTSLASYTLSDNFENLTGTGTASQWLTGNGVANAIAGGAGDDTLLGLDGNDSLNGGLGNDQMAGGVGDDIYTVDAAGDGVTENAGEGIDTVKTSLASYTLGDNFENLTGTGTAGQTLTGNVLANIISGGAGDDALTGGEGNDTLKGGTGNDALSGGEGNDTLNGGGGNDLLYGEAGDDIITGATENDRIEGGAGNDKLTGSAGTDTFVFHAGFGSDTITDFAAGASTGDVIEFHDGTFDDFAAVLAASHQVGSTVHINVDATNSIVLKNVALANLHQDDFVFA